MVAVNSSLACFRILMALLFGCRANGSAEVLDNISGPSLLMGGSWTGKLMVWPLWCCPTKALLELDIPVGAETEWPREAKTLLLFAAFDWPCSSRGRFMPGLEDIPG
jgi:hypothetical protein